MNRIVFVWGKYAPYHIDRIEAVKNLLGHEFEVAGIQKNGDNKTYAWDKVLEGRNFPLITLFPDSHTPPFFRTIIRLCRELASPSTRHVFLCEYQLPHIFVSACILRLLGKRVFIMANSKFDDKPRFLWREIFKMPLFLPYTGALVSGRRAAEYLRFLGFGKRPVIEGYNTLSTGRVRRNAGVPPAPEGVPFANRHFTVVARFVPKKNLPMLITAYAEYRRMAGASARELHFCGSGPEEKKIRARITELGVSGVIFHGFPQEEGVARVLGTSLALLLPSFDEQWGLVINEALAMGLPIICGDTVGARDALVRTAINGYPVETDNPGGLANLLLRMGAEKEEWIRMATASLELSCLGDVPRFAEGVKKLLEKTP